jgi:hypothetical protein
MHLILKARFLQRLPRDRRLKPIHRVLLSRKNRFTLKSGHRSSEPLVSTGRLVAHATSRPFCVERRTMTLGILSL